MTDYKVIADNLNKINPPLEIPDGLTKDKWPYYLSYPYLSTYGSLPDSGGDDNVKKPLTFKITSDGYIMWSCDSENAATIEYNKNGGEWTEITALPFDYDEPIQGGAKIDVVLGDVIMFRGNNNTYNDLNNGDIFGSFTQTTCGFNLEGNIMSLIDSSNFSSMTTMTSDNDKAFAGMFTLCTNLVSAENLILPVTVLANSCYSDMFGGCFSLVKAPSLPAIILAPNCYSDMFSHCSSLQTAPELPATSLVDSCYSGMFADCTSLNYIKCLATDISASDCTNHWVDGVASSGTFVKNTNMDDWYTGNDGIPSNWTIENYKTSIILSTYNCFVDSTVTNITINVISDDNWTASTNFNWISLPQSSGSSGETQLNILLGEFDLDRTGFIIFTCGRDKVSLIIEQAKTR